MKNVDQEFSNKIIAAVSKSLSKEMSDLTLESKFEDLDMDSASMICLIFEIEDEFNIQISQDFEAQEFKTVSDLAAAVYQEVYSDSNAA